MAVIVEHVLLSASDGPELSRMVSARIDQGWQPLSSPLASVGHLLQATVRQRGDEKRIRKTSMAETLISG